VARWLRLHEKGGKNHEMPVHHSLEAYLDAYLQAAGIGEDKKGALFRAALAKNGGLSRAAGIATQIGCHTFRATGITIYLTNGGTLEKAQMMAAHSSPRTTKLYDRICNYQNHHGVHVANLSFASSCIDCRV
jgi:integrase/recombinase XerD